VSGIPRWMTGIAGAARTSARNALPARHAAITNIANIVLRMRVTIPSEHRSPRF
jgi:hypothetical protein